MNTPTHQQLTPVERAKLRAYETEYRQRLASSMAHGRELARLDRALVRKLVKPKGWPMIEVVAPPTFQPAHAWL